MCGNVNKMRSFSCVLVCFMCNFCCVISLSRLLITLLRFSRPYWHLAPLSLTLFVPAWFLYLIFFGLYLFLWAGIVANTVPTWSKVCYWQPLKKSKAQNFADHLSIRCPVGSAHVSAAIVLNKHFILAFPQFLLLANSVKNTQPCISLTFKAWGLNADCTLKLRMFVCFQ